MAFDKRRSAAAANGFGPRSLLKAEAEALFQAWYPCPPDMRAGNRWSLGVAGVPVPDAPRPRERDWVAQIHRHYWHELTSEQRQQPEWHPSNTDRYDAEFRRIHAERVALWDGEGPPPRDKNIDGRYRFWGVPGRTLGTVMAHIADSDEPRLETAAPLPASLSAPRQWTSSSSRSPSSSRRFAFSSRSVSPFSSLRVPKPEQVARSSSAPAPTTFKKVKTVAPPLLLKS